MLTNSQVVIVSGFGAGFPIDRSRDQGQLKDQTDSIGAGSILFGTVVNTRRIVEIVCLGTVVVAVSGCCIIGKDRLQPARVFKPVSTGCWRNGCLKFRHGIDDRIEDFEIARVQASFQPTAQSSFALGEDAFALAERLHANDDDRAIDYWARTIAWTEDGLSRGRGCHCQQSCASPCKACIERVWRASRFRQSAMIRILSFGQCYGRLDPSSHLLLNGLLGTCHVPVVHEGFAWNPGDFNRLLVFKPPTDAPGEVCGRGVPLVVLTPPKRSMECQQSNGGGLNWVDQVSSTCDSFLIPETPFAATALINFPVSLFNETEISQDEEAASFRLINPLAVDPVGGCLGIAQSPSMPLIYARQRSEYKPIAAFVNGDNGVDTANLRFLEPYQPDKIPLILVHGLISDPATFLEMGDAIRADPLLRTRYQIWVFRYPTGEEFLSSAAILRQQLAQAFACHNASPVQGAVIVGHSLGGLVSKLQVTDSGDGLWRSIARMPLEQLRAPAEDIAEFRQAFYFQANPNISRIVYIATPHEGSPWASRGIGRFAARLAGRRSTEENDYETIAAGNPGVFTGEFADSLPSSVELLRPSSQLLQAISATETSPCVAVNSIIGDTFRLPRAGPSDIVVPVNSAFRAEAESTTLIRATHTSILRSSDAEQELIRILKMHLEMPAQAQ